MSSKCPFASVDANTGGIPRETTTSLRGCPVLASRTVPESVVDCACAAVPNNAANRIARPARTMRTPPEARLRGAEHIACRRLRGRSGLSKGLSTAWRLESPLAVDMRRQRRRTSLSTCDVVLTESIPTVEHRKAATGFNRRANPVSLTVCRLLFVGNHVGLGVVRRIRIEQRPVPLPDAFDAGRLREAIELLGLRLDGSTVGRSPESLPRPIVHDDHLGVDRVQESGRPCTVERSMATRLINRDATQLVCRAGKLHFLFPIQIGHIEKREFAKRQQCRKHPLILSLVLGVVLRGRAQRVVLASLVYRTADELAV